MLTRLLRSTVRTGGVMFRFVGVIPNRCGLHVFSGQPVRATLMPICHLDRDVFRDGGILEVSLLRESLHQQLRP